MSADNRLSAAKNAADNRLSAAKNAADNQLHIFPINQVYIKVFQFILVSNYLFIYFFLYLTNTQGFLKPIYDRSGPI